MSQLSRLVVVAGNTPRDRQPIVFQSSPRSWGWFPTATTNQKEEMMSYIFAHMGYENALWELDKLPSFLQTDEVSVRTIVQKHNLVCGELLATLERDMRISAECQESLERELLARRKAVETLTAKTKRMSDTIRKQGERLKELEAVKPCKCKQMLAANL